MKNELTGGTHNSRSVITMMILTHKMANVIGLNQFCRGRSSTKEGIVKVDFNKESLVSCSYITFYQCFYLISQFIP